MPHALTLGAICLAIGIFWPKKLSAILPAPLAALIVGTLLALFVFTGAPIIGEVPSSCGISSNLDQGWLGYH